jgi:eukaryotic-like serine/threonine-protein kinase
VVGGLSVQLSGSEQESLKSRSTNSVEAYNALLQARADWNEYFTTSQLAALRRAQDMAQHAVDADPGFVDAFALLGMSYALEATNFQQNGARNLALAEQAARKAFALNPQSFEATLSLGAIYGEQGKIADSLPMLRKAAAMAPNSPLAWKQLGYTSHYAGLIDLAEEGFRRGRDLDPTLPQAYWMHARMLLYQGKPHDAELEIRQALTRYPDQFKLLLFLGYFLYYQGKTIDGEPLQILAIVLASQGKRDEIDPGILRTKPDEVVDGDLAEWIGATHALLGENKEAIAWLKRAVQVGNHNYPWFQHDKSWNKLRGDPEFQRILSEVEGYWRNYQQLVRE